MTKWDSVFAMEFHVNLSVCVCLSQSLCQRPRTFLYLICYREHEALCAGFVSLPVTGRVTSGYELCERDLFHFRLWVVSLPVMSCVSGICSTSGYGLCKRDLFHFRLRVV